MRYVLLDQLYGQALKGLPVLGTPRETAQRFRAGTAQERARQITAFYVILGGSTGFAFGLTGLITAPVTVPANVASVAMLQLHLCATTAAASGHDPHDAAVREACVRCVLRNSNAEDADEAEEQEAQGFLARLRTKAVERGLRIGIEQAARFARRGARSLPLVGGLIGGVSDAYATGEIGRAAQAAFVSGRPPARRADA